VGGAKSGVQQTLASREGRRTRNTIPEGSTPLKTRGQSAWLVNAIVEGGGKLEERKGKGLAKLCKGRRFGTGE